MLLCVDMFLKTLVFLLLLTLSLAQDKVYCTGSNIKRAQATCNQAYTKTTDLSSICGKLDCIVECFKEAVSDCWKTDQFFNYDLKTTEIRYRAMCEDPEKAKRAHEACNPTFCEDQYLQPSYMEKLQELQNKGDFATYKTLECSRARDTLKCIQTAPVGTNCTTELEEISKGLETVKYSLQECGIAQEHKFFNTYADKGKPCSNPAVNNNCLITPLTEGVSKCLEIPGLKSLSDDLISSVCPNIECNLKCYLDAIGDCYKEDQWFNIDPKVITVGGRAICDSSQGTVSPFSLCSINNQTCEAELNTAYIEGNKHLVKGEYSDYKRIICSASNRFKTCADVSVTSTCTADMADKARNMIQVGYSFAACGPQDHAYFTKYVGDVNCVTSGYASIISSFVNTGLITMMAVMLVIWF